MSPFNQGLLSMPAEIFFEITSKLPSIPLPAYKQHPNLGDSPFPIPDAAYLQARFATLRSLSQTCRVLREHSAPLAWKCVDVVACNMVDNQPEKNQQSMAEELFKTLHILETFPDIAAQVKSFNVVLTSWDAENVIKRFGKCLALLPNLHQLQIFTVPGDPYLIDTAFDGIMLPQIKTLVIPSQADELLRHLPGLTTLHCDVFPSLQDDLMGLEYVLDAVGSCPELTTFDMSSSLIDYQDEDDYYDEDPEGGLISAIVDAMPKLTCFPPICLRSSEICKSIPHLARLEKLDMIQFYFSNHFDIKVVEAVMRVALETLSHSKTGSPEQPKFLFFGGKVGGEPVAIWIAASPADREEAERRRLMEPKQLIY
ncbi:hypothetical protein C8J56DRAFT_254931 [Mycena floridula]|nr:hypothetical protein C8J56DRAFT_254931 [Mycena floridula]